MSKKKMNNLIERAKGIRLDIGCGIHKQKGCLGMDIVPHPNVDIVHDIQKFPWPLDDNVCTFILLSHVFEHIEPKYRFQLMDECWRICKKDGQLWISCPYSNSFLESAHPAHYVCPNEATFEFFDSDYQLWHSCSYKKPKAWQIVTLSYTLGGTIEIVLSPRKDEKGRALKPPEKAVKYGSVHLIERKQEDETKWPKRKPKKKKR